MKSTIADVACVTLPKSIANATQAHLRKCGRQGLEGLALWVGTLGQARFDITELVIPKQEGIRGDHGLAVTVSAGELHRLNIWLYQKGLRLIAQIHSHPTHAFHSSTDDEYAIATTLGCLSLVVPDFAERPFALDDCATFRLSPSRWWEFTSRPRWRRVPIGAVERLIEIKD